MKSDLVEIPNIRLSDTKLQQVLQIVIDGNVVLNKFADKAIALAKSKGERYRRIGRRGFRKTLYKLYESNPKAKSFEVMGVTVPAAEVAKIVKIREHQYPLLCQFSLMIKKLAERWGRKDHGTTLSVEDFYDEGTIGFINAFNSYIGRSPKTNKKIKFVTYAWSCIDRHLIKVIGESNPFSPWSQKTKKLLLKFETTRLSDRLTFDETVVKLNLTPEEVQLISKMRSRLYNESSLPSTYDESGEEASLLEINAMAPAERTLEPDQKEVFKRLANDLTAWEKTVLEGVLQGRNKSDIALENINPETGESYSRQAPAVALERIGKKIIRLYSPKRIDWEAEAA